MPASSTANLNDEDDNILHQEDANTTGVNSSESPNGQDENKPTDMEAAVTAALQKTAAEQSSSSSDTGDKGKVTDPAKAAAGDQQPGEEGDLTDAELALLKPKTRRAFDRIRGQVNELNQQIEQFRPAAEKMQRIDSFINDAGLSAQDVNVLFNIGAMWRNDPAKAYEAITPLYHALAHLVGEVLPDDLQQQVQSGKITLEYAQELSRMRARDSIHTQRTTQTAERQQQEQEAQVIRETANAAGDAISKLEQQWQANDPDYRVKSTRIAERIELELLKGAQNGELPRNAQEAVEIAQRVKTEVDNEFKRFLPKKQAIQSVTGVSTQTGSRPAPKSTLEAIEQALGQ